MIRKPRFFMLYLLTEYVLTDHFHKNSMKSGTSFSQSASQCPPPGWQ